MMSKEPTIIEIAMDELEEILRRAEAKQFNDKDYETTRGSRLGNGPAARLAGVR